MIFESKEKKFEILNYSEELVKKHIKDLLDVDKVISGYPASNAINESKEIDGEEKWTLGNFIYPLPNKENLSVLVLFNNKCIGYMIASSYNDKSHLSRIAVLTEFQGNGLGKKLMNILEEESKKLGLKCLTLSTLYKGPEDKVVIFYKKLGYNLFDKKEEIKSFLKSRNKESDIDLFWPIKSGKLVVMSKFF